jgi:hypothetical protein
MIRSGIWPPSMPSFNVPERKLLGCFLNSSCSFTGGDRLALQRNKNWRPGCDLESIHNILISEPGTVNVYNAMAINRTLIIATIPYSSTSKHQQHLVMVNL